MDARAVQFQREVGLLIKKHRAVAGISQEALAASLGLSRASVANMEVGRQKIGVTLLYQIAEILQTTPHDLLPGTRDESSDQTSDVRLPKSLPEEEKQWIHSVMKAGETSIAKGRKKKPI